MQVATVTSILNNDFLLLKSYDDESFKVGEDLLVYGEIELEGGAEIGVKKLRFPKGLITITAQQEENNYLATVLKTKEERKTVYKNNPFTSLNLSSLFGQPEEVVVNVPVRQKAVLDTEKSLNINFDLVIRVGDKITREGKI